MKKKRISPKKRQAFWFAAGMVVLLAALALCVYGMYWAVTNALTESEVAHMENTADHDGNAAQAVFQERETALTNWATSVRNAGFTDLADIMDNTSQGSALIGAKQLFLIDDDFFYYGNNGLIMQLGTYDADLQAMQTEVQTQYSADSMLTFAKIQPFTVEGATFVYALAEFDIAAYQNALKLALFDGETYAGIIDSDGEEIVSTNGDTSFLHLMDTTQMDGYASWEILKQGLANQDRLDVTCHVNGERSLLIFTRLPDREWILVTLDPVSEAASPLSPIMLRFFLLAALLVAAVQFAFVQWLRAHTLRKRVTTAEDSCAALQKELTSAQEINRSQTAFLDVISHNIRTPLNGIVGYSALAMRHFREPERVQEYLKKIVEASGQLLSKLNEGLDATGWHTYLEEETTVRQEPERAIDLTGKRILLVEDNALNREIGEAILTEIGMLVECAENGELGFQRLAASKPGYFDLVLMDIQMPVMDGYEATKTIRRLRSKMLAEIPILAMTANVSQEDKRKAFESGMNGYVEKPMNIEKLLNAMQKALRQSVAD